MSEPFVHFELRSAPQVFRCEPEWHWRVPSMPDYDLWCVLSGRGEMVVDGLARPIMPGSCWLLAPGVSCCASHDPSNRARVFSVHLDLLTSEGRVRALMDGERSAPGAAVHDLALLESMARSCVDYHRRGDALGRSQAKLCVRQILLMLLQGAQQPASAAGDDRVVRVHQAVIEDPGHPWSVSEMASLAGLSRSQFTRRFRAMTGRAPTQCLLEARMERACHLLRETQLRVGEIAELLGYSDIYYFSRQFKALVGVPPTRFREVDGSAHLAQEQVYG